MQKHKLKQYEGFTLIEILVVVGLIAILAAITIVALNPAQQFSETRDTSRRSDINTILNAVSQYLSKENNDIASLESLAGATIPACDAVLPDIDRAPIGTGGASQTIEVDLDGALVDEYLVAIPTDPQGGTIEDTGYEICQTSGGRITIFAPGAENETDMSVSR
jgi:prepilin-type N-terminal cleavage/methylation domain-containing protein